MSTIGSGAGLVAMLFTMTLSGAPVLQRGDSPAADIKPYAGAVEFCNQHIVGAPQADRKAGAHISWTGYYSTDPLEQVVRHYTTLLGSTNHQREGNEDTWRFPLDKPERVLTVMPPKSTLPLDQCKPLPKSARAVVVISMMTRPD